MSIYLERPSSYLTQVRDVGLISGEKVVCLYAPKGGIVTEPTRSGRLLVATNQRIMSFDEDRGNQETMLIPIEDFKGVSVKSGSGNSLSPTQGLLMLAGGLVVYLVLSYWLVDRFHGPSLPIINLDVVPVILLLAMISAGWFAWRYSISSEGGAIKFLGSSWSFSLPYSGETSGEEIFQMINLMYAARNWRSSQYVPVGESRY